MTSACKLLLCGPFPDPVGGVSTHLQRLLCVLRRDARFSVRCLDESGLRKAAIFNIRSLNLLAYLKLMWWADLVHVQSSVPVFRLMHLMLAKLMGKKIVLTLHSYRPRHKLEHWFTRMACRLPDVVIAVSEDIRVAVCPRARVIPAYIAPTPEEEAVPADLLAWIEGVRAAGRKLIVSNASKLVRFDGADLYGLDLLVDIFNDPAIRSDYALLFIVSSLSGCEASFARYQHLIAERGLSEVIALLHRPLPFAGLLRQCDLSVRATNTDGDALSIRESLYYGRRTIASDCVARPLGTELFASRDCAALAAVIKGPVQASAYRDESFDRVIVDLYASLL